MVVSFAVPPPGLTEAVGLSSASGLKVLFLMGESSKPRGRFGTEIGSVLTSLLLPFGASAPRILTASRKLSTTSFAWLPSAHAYLHRYDDELCTNCMAPPERRREAA